MTDDKVKVAMFLPPPIAQAIKIRAARDGTGVSEVINTMFQCAHCREPITDEFIVGKPKQIAPNRYAVFYHKNRKKCVAASGNEFRFFMRCPKCDAIPQMSFERGELEKLIRKKAIEFYCISCDHRWQASSEEARAIAHALDAQ